MRKQKTVPRPFAPGTIQYIKSPMSFKEKIAVMLFFFVLLMLLSYCIASIYGYVELQGRLV